MRQSWYVKLGITLLAFIVLGFVCLPFDVSIAHAMLQDWMPGELRGIFRRGEIFGHGYGIAAIALTICLLSPKNRSAIPRLILNCLAAGLAVDLLKVMVWRTRPRTYEMLSSNEGTFVGTIFTTDGWTWAQVMDSSQHSFPSAHTATAVAMAITLAKLFPAGRWWFATLAFLCAMNRIDGGAHFASDVFWGAAIGIATTGCCYRSRMVNRFLARWENVDAPIDSESIISFRQSA